MLILTSVVVVKYELGTNKTDYWKTTNQLNKGNQHFYQEQTSTYYQIFQIQFSLSYRYIKLK